MLWVLLSLLESSALVVQLRLLIATAVVLYRTTVYVIIMHWHSLCGHAQVELCPHL